MDITAWLTVAVTAGCVLLMIFTQLGPDLILLGGVVILLTAGVIDADQALSGFSNQGMITVALMYVLAAGIRETGGVESIVRHVLGRPRRLTHAQLRVMLPVFLMSAFLNNTPVVATFIPAVVSWARRTHFLASKLLLPLSYAAILGGTCTLIGTSTNLVVNGLVIARDPAMALGLFEISWVGVPAGIAGLLYILLLSRYLLPDRASALSTFENPREYTIEMEIEANGPLVDRTIEQAGLRHLGGVYLVEIERDGNVIAAVGPGERLKAGDRLVFAGSTEAAIDLQQIKGLRPSTHEGSALMEKFPERCIVEAVVSRECALVGQTIRAGRFRSTYGASVLAVCRSGQRVKGNLGNIRLQAADTLLMEARPAFLERHRQSRDFLLVSSVDGASRPFHEKALWAWGILLGVVVLATTGMLSMLNAVLLGAAMMLLTGCCSVNTARRSIDAQVLLTIAASFGIGKALEMSGAAEAIAQAFLGIADGTPYLLLICTYILVSLLTELITNNAAAVLVFPIILATTEALGVSSMPFIITLMMAASASFATPIGYQTNLMVYGPGGYKFRDYVIFGGMLNVVTGIVTVLVVPHIWPF